MKTIQKEQCPRAFSVWVTARYKAGENRAGKPTWKDNRFGDMAGDMYGDKDFPKESKSSEEVLTYLRDRHACRDAIDAARALLKKYRAYLR